MMIYCTFNSSCISGDVVSLRHKFEDSLQLEPEPIDDERVNRMEAAKVTSSLCTIFRRVTLDVRCSILKLLRTLTLFCRVHPSCHLMFE